MFPYYKDMDPELQLAAFKRIQPTLEKRVALMQELCDLQEELTQFDSKYHLHENTAALNQAGRDLQSHIAHAAYLEGQISGEG